MELMLSLGKAVLLRQPRTVRNLAMTISSVIAFAETLAPALGEALIWLPPVCRIAAKPPGRKPLHFHILMLTWKGPAAIFVLSSDEER